MQIANTFDMPLQKSTRVRVKLEWMQLGQSGTKKNRSDSFCLAILLLKLKRKSAPGPEYGQLRQSWTGSPKNRRRTKEIRRPKKQFDLFGNPRAEGRQISPCIWSPLPNSIRFEGFAWAQLCSLALSLAYGSQSLLSSLTMGNRIAKSNRRRRVESIARTQAKEQTSLSVYLPL